MKESKLFDKILGCIIGGAVGDAMGIPVEMMHYEDIEAQFGKVTTFVERQKKRFGEHPFYETITVWYAQVRRMPTKLVIRFVKMGDKVRKLLGRPS